jgi:hypothetical protein
MDVFTYRGEENVTTQWILYTTVHNVGKCVPLMGGRWKKITGKPCGMAGLPTATCCIREKGEEILQAVTY